MFRAHTSLLFQFEQTNTRSKRIKDCYTTHHLVIIQLDIICVYMGGRGRPRRRWTQDIGEWMGVSTVEAGRQALERLEFRQAVWEATFIKDPP